MSFCASELSRECGVGAVVGWRLRLLDRAEMELEAIFIRGRVFRAANDSVTVF